MLYQFIVPQFGNMLKNLSRILEKAGAHAEAKKYDVDILLNSRLYPDQFNLIRQVQIACDTAKLGVARLTGKDAPVNDDEEKSLPELQARIEGTLNFLQSIDENDFKGAEERKVSQPRWEGKYLNGLEFAIQHAIPNLYFHVTTAYSILRHNGVEVGKKDYLGEMPYKKPQS